MSQKVFALLVGINDYAPEVGKLSGCLNDVDHFRDYLNGSFDNTTLAIEVLKDADATRDNIVKLFRTHLGKAKADDVAVFQYCGHGARWSAAKEFNEFYPDGKDEGLVCYDSRRDKGVYPFDLADKELAVLLAEVAANNPHLAVILDCCHSGSGTRDADAFSQLKARQTHEVFSERPLDSYLDGYYEKLRKKGAALSIPRSKHILLAACDRKQKAYEAPDRSGLFTSTMLTVLQTSGSDITYADLFTRCRSEIRRKAENQTPQFETGEDFNALSGFLGRNASSATRLYSVYFNNGAWTVDAGALHGLPTEADKTVGLALYAEDNRAQLVGRASTTLVGPQKSELQLDFEGDQNSRYYAEMTSLPVAPIPVFLDGEEPGKAVLRNAANPSFGVELTDTPNGTRYSIVARQATFMLKQRELDRDIQGVKEFSEGSANMMLSVAKHVVQWERGLALQNHSTQIDTSLVEFLYAEKLEDGQEFIYPDGEITLDFVKSEEQWKEIRGKIKARNRTQQTLHCLLTYFSPSYGIHILRNDPVPPGEEFVTLWGEDKEDYFYLEENENQSLENFKLIVSTERVDDFLLAQQDLEMGKVVSATRAIGTVKPMKKVAYENDWLTKDLRIKVVRQIDRVGTKDASVAKGKIVVKSHPAVQANVSLRAAAVPTRSAAVPTRSAAVPTRSAAVPTRSAAVPTRSAAVPTRSAAVPTRGIEEDSDFYKALERQGLEMLNFAGTRGDNESILELTDIQNASSLKEHPLEIEVRVPLKEDEAILPFVFDGQHVLLGGDAYKDENGNTRISIDHIPELPDNRRSLGSALKLYFFKTYLKQESVNQLRWVEFKPDGTFAYQKSNVADKVSAAQNVLLLVHGIIGDTEAMAKGVQETGLAQKFDLVLTYDYENLSTPIQETALKLKSQLTAVGLHEHDTKKLTLLVHSMGGLVTRWFIEREGGNKMVDHLVMCGTPNNGSPFGKIDGARKILNVLTGLAVNYVPMFIPFSGTVLLLLNRSKNITPTLEQMNPSSDFIKTLNASEDPGIRYTILAGDVDTYEEPSDQFFAKMLAKVGQSSVFEALFGMKANDIAVSVESILGVESGRANVPARTNVACHHLNYFVSPAGQQALKAVQW